MAEPGDVAGQRKDGFAVVLACDEATTRLLGWSPEDVIGRRSLDFVHPADADRIVEDWLELIGQPGGTSRCRMRYRHKNGSYVTVEITNHNRLDTDGYVWGELRRVDTDTTEDRPAGDEDERPVEQIAGEAVATATVARILREQQRLLRRLTDGLPGGVAQLGAGGEVLHTNTQLAKLLGVADPQSVGELFTAVAPADRGPLEKAVRAVLAGHDRDLDITVEDPYGTALVAVNLRALIDETGMPTGAIVCASDITDASRLRAELERRASIDSLTGCLNRASIIAELDVALRAGGGVAVIYIDLDRFKAVNDRHGHHVGDRLLTIVAARLARAAADHGALGRLGGDEFLLVCPAVPEPADALAIAERVAHGCDDPITLGELTLTTTASVGAAHTTSHLTSDELIHAADTAMYQAKRGDTPSPTLITLPG